MEIMNMKLKMMATLWDNTYRVAIDDGQGKYIGYCTSSSQCATTTRSIT